MKTAKLLKNKKGDFDIEKTRFVRVVRIGSEHYDDTEQIVNQNVSLLRDSGAKIISIQALSIPFLMYNIIYEAETEISGTAVTSETKEEIPESETAETETSEDSVLAETSAPETDTDKESGECHADEENKNS